MHPRNGMVRATFEVTGTMDAPQIVEIPLTLTRRHGVRVVSVDQMFER